MLVVSDYEVQDGSSRSQPWGKTSYSENGGQYHSFRQQPELIREVLEDFKPYEDQRAVQEFYCMLEWLNRPNAFFETNDCALRPPFSNPDAQFSYTHKINGRLEFFLRELSLNKVRTAMLWVYRMLSLHLQVERPDARNAIFDISGAPTDYIDLPGSENERTGVRFSIQFSAYGNGDTQAWSSLFDAINSLFEAFKGVERGFEGDFLKFP